jgi:hypothetical protein
MRGHIWKFFQIRYESIMKVDVIIKDMNADTSTAAGEFYVTFFVA